MPNLFDIYKNKYFQSFIYTDPKTNENYLIQYEYNFNDLLLNLQGIPNKVIKFQKLLREVNLMEQFVVIHFILWDTIMIFQC